MSGIGDFYPDGPGSLSHYKRAFLMDVGSVVPEPGFLTLLGIAGVTALLRRRAPNREVVFQPIGKS